MTILPTGSVTLLFTDIEGSTRLLQRLGSERYGELLAEHHRTLRETIAAHSGVEVKTEGDSFFVVFPRAQDAVTAAVDAQRRLSERRWPAESAVTVRMGVHTGDVAISAGEYVGLDVHRAARIAAAGHGGQVLVSDATRGLVERSLPDGVSLRDIGDHRLKDLERPEHLYQLVIDGLRADFPPLRALSPRFGILPAETSEFVGRERELRRTRELLRRTRLLTLTGPGGTGKTRLSLQLARSVAGEFADGVGFVPLAPITQPELVAPTIRQTLGLAEQVGRGAIETLIDELGERDVLIVLDNFEQVLAGTPIVAQLLEGTDRLKVVVTSRSPLHLTGEQEFGVPPLELPSPERADDLRALSQSEAVALFMQRARALRPEFELTAANARAIVEICRRLDGLPLAIELAASRVKLLPPQSLLARLERRLDVLQSTAADRTDRQRTLRGAIDWSFDLLSSEEQALFRRLSIFVGGWSLDAASEVAPAGGSLAVDTLDGLTALVDQSLIRQTEQAGEARFEMLETIREYGLERLDGAGELEAVARAHAEHFAGLVAAAVPHLTESAEWADRLELEHDNVRAMLRWAAANDVDRGLRTAGALWRFWHLRGHLREGRRVLSDLLALPAAGEQTPARAKALIGLAGLVYWMKDHEAAQRAYDEALPIADQYGDRQMRAEILYSLGYVHAIRQSWDASVAAYTAARDTYEELGAEGGAAYSIMGLGMVASLRGDHERAIALCSDAISRFERLGEAFGSRNAWPIMVRAYIQLGRLESAREASNQSLRAAHAARDPTNLTQALLDRAALEALAGSAERAARLLGAGEALIEWTGGEAPPELVNRVDPVPLLGKRLGQSAFEELRADGRRMSAEQAVAYALDVQPEAVEQQPAPTAGTAANEPLA